MSDTYRYIIGDYVMTNSILRNIYTLSFYSIGSSVPIAEIKMPLRDMDALADIFTNLGKRPMEELKYDAIPHNMYERYSIGFMIDTTPIITINVYSENIQTNNTVRLVSVRVPVKTFSECFGDYTVFW